MASVRAEVAVRIPLRSRKRLAALMLIRQHANVITTEQPWNEDAKAIRRLAGRLLRSIQVK